jgi:hypothetical protein
MTFFKARVILLNSNNSSKGLTVLFKANISPQLNDCFGGKAAKKRALIMAYQRTIAPNW